jgi:hypothetical protein
MISSAELNYSYHLAYILSHSAPLYKILQRCPAHDSIFIYVARGSLLASSHPGLRLEIHISNLFDQLAGVHTAQ